jgi:membrane protein DedA with SNARE-associated domain
LPSVSLLLDQVAVQGPWLLFVMALLETSFVQGFFVPVGVALSFFAALAAAEGFPPVLAGAAAAAAGGAIGDTIGYWIGRKGQERWSRGTGRMARHVIAAHERTAHWFGGSPLLSITIPRLISFVRTVMPLAAGMSGIPYVRFLRFEIPGVILWSALYVTAGLAAGEGWSWAARLLGPEVAAVLLAAVMAAGFVIRRRLQRARVRSG